MQEYKHNIKQKGLTGRVNTADGGAKRAAKLIITLTIAVCAALCFSACDETNTENTESKEKVTYTEVAHLNFPINNIRTLNPATSVDEDTYFISRLIFDGLFELDNNMTPVPVLADRYKFRKKESSLTVSLIDAKFHDGKSLRAKDVKFTIDAYKAAGSSCRYKPLVDKISYCTVKGKKKIKIYFKSSTDMALSMLTFPIMPAHRYDSIYQVAQSKGGFKPVGTGKYKYKKFANKKSLELSPNKDYHGEVPENSLSFIVTKESSAAYQLVEASSLSALITTSPERGVKVGQKKQKVIDFPGNEVEFIGFNFDNDAMNKKAVRKAIAYAIDTDAIIEEDYVNSGISNDTVFYPGYMGTDRKKDQYAQDEDKAETRLRKAGYIDRNSDGVVESRTGVSLNLNILVCSDDKYRENAAETIKDQLEEVGISSFITSLPKKSYIDALKKGSFDIFVGGLKYDEVMDMRVLLKGEKQEQKIPLSNYNTMSGNNKNNQQSNVKDEDIDYDDEDGETTSPQQNTTPQTTEKKLLSKKMDNYNYARYYNPEVNKNLNKMMSGATVDDTAEAFNKVRITITDELPYYCLLQKTFGAVQAPAMEGEMTPVFDNYYNGIGKLKCRYEEPADDEEE